MHPSRARSWSLFRIEEVEKHFHIQMDSGVNSSEVSDRRERYGTNAREAVERHSGRNRILKQFQSPLVIILLLAAAFALGIGERLNATIILLAVLVNFFVGVFQEGKADTAFRALKKSEGKVATVLRDRHRKQIKAEDVVVGDVIILATGFRVPADARIIDAHGLLADESALTGEANEVEKSTHALGIVVPLAEQVNMVFAGTLIVSGYGRAIVTAVGTDTEYGKIGNMLTAQSLEGETPLQAKVRGLSLSLVQIVFVALVLIVILGIIRGEPIRAMFAVGIAIAVSAIPEGLPSAVAVVLAVGMEAILRKGGLVRSMLAGETLGSTSVILTDKTGTLTTGEMRVTDIITYRSLVPRDGSDLPLHASNNHKDEEDVLMMGVLASDAFVEHEGEAMKDWVIRGRPAERAILSFGLEMGLRQKELLKDFARMDYIPFASVHRFSASLHRIAQGEGRYTYLSGAPEELLRVSKYVHLDGRRHEKGKDEESVLHREHVRLTREGMRIIAIAYIPNTAKTFTDAQRIDPLELLKLGVTFAGIIVLNDPVRTEVPEAVRAARRAGARVIMVTGDHPDTARAIAHQAGIVDAHDHPVYTGKDIEKLSDTELLKVLRSTKIFARMLPADKLRLSRVLQASGEIVAMTGDGVNDAPALRGANIGVALGSGTEVAKESSDLVLLSNSFSVIVEAIGEGRRIVDNIRKILIYLLSTSFGEIILVGGALAFGLPLPMTPAQIIWTNMITEGFLNFAFAFEPRESDVMKRKPIPKNAPLLDGPMTAFTWGIGIGGGLILFLLYYDLRLTHVALQITRTALFIASSGIALFITLSIKDLRTPIWKNNIFSNAYLWTSLSVSLIAFLIVFAVAPLSAALNLSPLSQDLPWAEILASVISAIALSEILKMVFIERRLSK